MADANPKCEHCSKPMVFIGIGPAVEPVRTCKCEDGPPCTMCGTRRTEPFNTWSYWSPVRNSGGTYHCIPYGHVFTPKGTP